ncbi:MAG: adenylate/guanylate cyclase domain-containing protein [Leptospiraceae bacterium]|nr:adenylate/guanylate cyclase domain-containing protein [Leptospiraceae bacterium]
MSDFWRRLIRIGVHEGVPARELRYITLLNGLAIVVGLLLLANIPFTAAYLPDTAFILGVQVADLAACVIALFLNARRQYLAARLCFNLIAAINLATYPLATGTQTGAHFLQLLVIVAAFYLYPPRETVIKYSVIALSTLFLILWSAFDGSAVVEASRDWLGVQVLPEPLLNILSWAMPANVAIFMLAFMYYGQAILRRAEDRTEALLRNILPEPIMQRLKQGEAVIADSFSSVTVLFADIVGFTELAGRTPPEKLVQILNAIFSRFDDLVEDRGLEKIKTIGDAYMVVGGLPVRSDDHVALVCRLGLEMLSEIKRIEAARTLGLNIRIGIHTGPVAAGVIGRKKFSYDLWGDTVNVASRMESQGIPGEIQVTESVHAEVHGGFELEPRGSLQVKGKGPLSVYLLRSGPSR